jgi:hypothetical protein
VLDWELAHLGDRHQDLAFGCINSWRFGHIDRPAFGVGQFEELFTAYESESGVAVDLERFRWWLVYSTLWWGICCLQMAEIWRSGLDAGLERAVIGRRASETEVDLLMLLEEDAPDAEKNLPVNFAPATVTLADEIEAIKAAPLDDRARRQGEPSTLEMLEALSQWIEADIKASARGREKFMAAVAMNALNMLKREAENPIAIHDQMMSDDLLSGWKSLETPGLLAQLKAQSLAKLAADQPKYSALAVAMKKWSN